MAQRRQVVSKHVGITKGRTTAELAGLERQFYSHELAIASDIQSHLLPKRIPKVAGFEMTAFYDPCEYVGGDYYDFIEIDEDHLGIVVADVSGKGVPGALVMVQARTLMRSEATRSRSPREVLIRMNKLLHEDIPRGMFVTMFYVQMTIPSSEIVCCSAGHLPMILWRARERKEALVHPKGLALGIDRGPLFEQSLREVRIDLRPEDRFIVYTDGVVEAMDQQRNMYGFRRLARKFLEFAGNSCDNFLNSLLTELREFRGSAPPHDDITVVTVRRLPKKSDEASGLYYVSGERFVRCRFCETINARELRRCTICKEPLEEQGSGLHLKVGWNEIECACGRLFLKDRRACPYCMRPVCTRCKKRVATQQLLCDRCAS